MRKIEKLKMEYIGYSEPENNDELEIEILGLEMLIRAAEHRVSLLKQGRKLAEMANAKERDE